LHFFLSGLNFLDGILVQHALLGLHVELLRDHFNLLSELFILGLLRLDILEIFLMGLFQLNILILVVLDLVVQGAAQTVVVSSEFDILIRHVFDFGLQESRVLFNTRDHIILVVLDGLQVGLELIL
jgi:hypothetical protein